MQVGDDVILNSKAGDFAGMTGKIIAEESNCWRVQVTESGNRPLLYKYKVDPIAPEQVIVTNVGVLNVYKDGRSVLTKFKDITETKCLKTRKGWIKWLNEQDF